MFKIFFIICFSVCLGASVIQAAAIQAPTKDDYENFKKSLRLTPVQTRIIGEIELQTENKNKILREKYTKAHREYIELSQNCIDNTCFKRLPELREEMKDLSKKMYNNTKIRDEMIIKVLFPGQKGRYKEYRSRVY